MRILDRYVAWQLLPVWLWCTTVFLVLSSLVDLFGHLDEILRYHISTDVLVQYYLNFFPLVFVHAAPFALLLSTAFIAGRLARHSELLAVTASGTSLLRISIPFLFIGWCVSLGVFAVNERIIPHTSLIQERLQREVFREPRKESMVENVATMDSENRIYHARKLDTRRNRLYDLTVLEHDAMNHPIRNWHANQAIWTRHGWLLLYGTVYPLGDRGTLTSDPIPFVERLLPFPVTPQSFSEPQMRPEYLPFGQLRLFIERLKEMGVKNLKRYRVELVAKLSVPFINIVICLIAFAGSCAPSLRGSLKGLGISLGWGTLYYIVVHFSHAIAKAWPVPLFLPLILPHALALGLCFRELRRIS